MPKLSPSIKSLLTLPRSNPSPLPLCPPAALHRTLDSIRSACSSPLPTSSPSTSSTASSAGAGPEAWLTVITAAGVTVNSPETFVGIWNWARKILHHDGVELAVSIPSAEEAEGRKGERRISLTGLDAERWGAGMMREVGLKCISFNGIPRTINALNALRDALPEEVSSGLSTEQTRQPTPTNINSITAQSRALWDAIYFPQHEKLINKLHSAHPDLPVHILNSHYGALLSDPESSPVSNAISGSTNTSTVDIPRAGRVLTSLIAISCLRAQGGVGPQVLSHVYGLMKAAEQPGEEGLQGREWLTGEEGVRWALESTDKVCEAVRGRVGGDVSGLEAVKAKL